MKETPHILIVDDDREIRTLLGRFLAARGCRVSAAAEGGEMRRALDAGGVDLIVLDLMLPGSDGLTLCRDLRAAGDATPIIMLTAMDEIAERIVGLEMGADDYLTKPFDPRELLARIRAVLRREEATPRDAARGLYRFAGWRLESGARELRAPSGAAVALSAGEFDLLLAFVAHPQRVLSRDRLLDWTRGRAAGPFDRSVDVQVSRLRKKIEDDPKRPRLIKTARGGGYLLTATVEREGAA